MADLVRAQTAPHETLTQVRQWATRLADGRLADPPRLEALDMAIEEAERGGLSSPPLPFMTILLLGPSGVGKSQLLNALAGERIARVHHLRPTTKIPTVYAHVDLPVERLFEYGTVFGEWAGQPNVLHRHQREALRDKVIMDAPDIDSHCREHRELVHNLLSMVDVVLYVVTAESYRNDLGWQTVLHQRGKRGFAFVLNKWDSHGKSSLESGESDVDHDFMAMIRSSGGYEHPRLFRISAEYWVQRHSEPFHSAAPPKGDEFPELEQWLSRGLSTGQAGAIQRRRRRALLGSLAAAMARAIPHELPAVWCSESQAALDATLHEGSKRISSGCRELAVAMVGSDETLTWPRSPGPFGLFMRLITAVTSWHRPRADPSAIRAAESGIPSSLEAMLATTIEQVAALARNHQVPAAKLIDQLNELAGRNHDRLNRTIAQVAEELANPAGFKLRRYLGLAIVAAVEATLVLVMIVAGYRLSIAFATGHYLGSDFVGNFLLLVVICLALGWTGLGCVLPRRYVVARRRLEQRIQAAWQAILAEHVAAIEEFRDEVAQARATGESLASRVNAEMEACVRAESQDEVEVERLFVAETKSS